MSVSHSSGNGSGDGALIRVTIIEYNAAVIEDLPKGWIEAECSTMERPGEEVEGDGEPESPGEHCHSPAE